MSKKQLINDRLNKYNAMNRAMDVWQPEVPPQYSPTTQQVQQLKSQLNSEVQNNKQSIENYYSQTPLTTNAFTNPRHQFIPQNQQIDRRNQLDNVAGHNRRSTMNSRLSNISPFSGTRALPIVDFKIVDNKPINTTLGEKKKSNGFDSKVEMFKKFF
tara:strand:- start:916 stop:1386 length:471 start_codon:yes stop_codon:yes gene_type:complete